MTDLERIRAAAANVERAHARLRAAVAETARSGDVDITAIARAAGVSRPTVYRWSRQASSPTGDES